MKNESSVPLMIGLALMVGLFVYYFFQPDHLEDLSSREVAQKCTTDMATKFHIHSHLTIMANKKLVPVPVNIGIEQNPSCLHSLHTHDETSVIHVESPVKKDFTLGDFFFLWEKPLSSDRILDFATDSDHGLKMYINGRESTEFDQLVLQDYEDIFLDYYALSEGPDDVPGPFNWSAWEKQSAQEGD